MSRGREHLAQFVSFLDVVRSGFLVQGMIFQEGDMYVDPQPLLGTSVPRKITVHSHVHSPGVDALLRGDSVALNTALRLARPLKGAEGVGWGSGSDHPTLVGWGLGNTFAADPCCWTRARVPAARFFA